MSSFSGEYHDSAYSTLPNDQASVRSAWWRESDNEIHKHVFPIVSSIIDEQRARRQNHRLWLGMYDGAYDIDLIEGGNYIRRQDAGMVRLNMLCRLASTATSKIAKNKPRILYLSDGGNWSQRERAKRMTKVINGAFHDAKIYEVQPQAFLDSCIFDSGFTHYYRMGDQICAEKILPHEVLVDAFGARYGKPRVAYVLRQVARETLADHYGKKALENTPRSNTGTTNTRYISDMVDVVMAYHLPMREGDKGHYACCVKNKTLEPAPWMHAYFPWTRLVWNPMPVGYYGQGIGSQIYGLQQNILKTINDVQEHCDLSTGFIAMEVGSKINDAFLTNIIWRVAEYTNTPPQYIAPPAFSPEKLQFLSFLIDQCYDETGISELAASARKPAGLNSGAALREYNDQESERFQLCGQRYEQSFVDAATIIADLYEDAHEAGESVEVRAYNTRGNTFDTIDWTKARMDRKSFTVRPVPTGFLPSTAAGKLEKIQEMMQAGMLSKEESMLLLDYPDLESVTNPQNAARLLIEKQIEIMLDPDDPQPMVVEPAQNYDLAIRLAENAANEARIQGAPDEAVYRLLAYADSARRAIENATQQMAAKQAPPMAPGPMPPGAPMPPDPAAMMPPGAPAAAPGPVSPPIPGMA